VRESDEADALYILTSGRARVIKRGDHGEEVPLGSLAAGDFFGELALLENSPRTATVRASSAVEVLRLNRAVFEGLVRTNASARRAAELAVRHDKMRDLLRTGSAFSGISENTMTAVLDALKDVSVVAGEAIVHVGDAAGSMYIVRAGRLLVLGAKGEALNYLRPGDSFGERALMLGEPRSATVEAFTDCELLELDPGAFRQLQDGHADFRTHLERQVDAYAYRRTARVPLDFADELLPAGIVADIDLVNDLEELDAAGQTVPEGALPAARSAGAGAADEVSTRPAHRLRRFPHLHQLDAADCGAACLTSVCHYFGRKVSLARVRRAVQTSTDGTSLAGIAHGAERLGLAARTLKVSKRLLDELPLPAIVHWEGNHCIGWCCTTPTRSSCASPIRPSGRVASIEASSSRNGRGSLRSWRARRRSTTCRRAAPAWPGCSRSSARTPPRWRVGPCWA
jgi:ATP-binding cassette subfamily B protein